MSARFRRSLLVGLTVPFALTAQQQQSARDTGPSSKKPLTVAEYGRWSQINAAVISPRGDWMAYVLAPNAGDSTLIIRSLDSDATTRVAGGSSPRFSDDGNWVAYTVVSAQPRTPPARRSEVMNIATGAKTPFPNAASVQFTKGSRFLIVKLGRPAGQTTGGTLLLVRNLATNDDRPIGNVDLFALDADATRLAYTVDAPDRLGNGVFVLTLATGVTTPLSTGAFDYAGLAWDARAPRLAALRGDRPAGKRQRDNSLFVWNDLAAAPIEVTASSRGVRGGHVISELTTPQFSRDGARVYFGVKEQEAEPPRSDAPQANVDVWHWLDASPQTRQAIQLAQDRRATYTAVVEIATKTVATLGDSVMRAVPPAQRSRWSVGRIDTAYRTAISWFSPKSDYYRVNVETGERQLIDRGIAQIVGTSPEDRFVYVKNRRLHSFDLASGTAQALDGSIEVVDDDIPGGGTPSRLFGTGGWTRDGRALIVYGRFDVYAFPLDGSKAINLTRGTGTREQIEFRVATIPGGGDGAPGVDLAKPLILSAYGEWTKRSGYYSLAPDGGLAPILFVDKAIGNLQRAQNADRAIFTQQTATEFPDYWVASASLAGAKRVTDANPILRDYTWTPRRVLLDYTNRAGRRLQGTLTLPANYAPGKRYPMIVHYYERTSNQHHQFGAPFNTDRFNVAAYASAGYLVLQPDIVFEIGKPGTSALDCVTAAVRKAIALGYADSAHMGVQGHSWGGYESAFIITQTSMFSAAVIGAPPSNPISLYSAVYKSLGYVNQGMAEVGQMRMGEGNTPWNAHALYESQSPVHHAAKITTPFLILHGTADGAVDYNQSLELFGAARRNGKRVILLSYPDEGHHLAKRENQVDFQIRMQQFFDHHLRGAAAPGWMTSGVPQTRKGEPPQ